MEQQRGSEGGRLVGRAVKKGPGVSPAPPSLGLWPLQPGMPWDLTEAACQAEGVDGWGPERSRCSQRPGRQVCTEHLCSLKPRSRAGRLIQSHPGGGGRRWARSPSGMKGTDLRARRRMLRLTTGTSLVVQRLRLCAPSAGIPGLIPGEGTQSHMLQLKTLCAATKTWHNKNH